MLVLSYKKEAKIIRFSFLKSTLLKTISWHWELGTPEQENPTPKQSLGKIPKSASLCLLIHREQFLSLEHAQLRVMWPQEALGSTTRLNSDNTQKRVYSLPSGLFLPHILNSSTQGRKAQPCTGVQPFRPGEQKGANLLCQ